MQHFLFLKNGAQVFGRNPVENVDDTPLESCTWPADLVRVVEGLEVVCYHSSEAEAVFKDNGEHAEVEETLVRLRRAMLRLLQAVECGVGARFICANADEERTLSSSAAIENMGSMCYGPEASA